MIPQRAVIYCRCSTEEESQRDALLKQVEECILCVQEQHWCLTDRYVESKSGTTTKGRWEYNRLFDDLLLDSFDIIVIKSQDRLMRNVKDWYLFLDRMLKQGKRMYMYLEHKFYSSDDALITGIKAILAEEYSRELSKKINNAHRSRQQHGGKAILTSKVYGYKKRSDGSVMVMEPEAAVIQRIFEYSYAGYGSRKIAAILLEQGCQKRTGEAFTSGFIGRMLRNPLYKGHLIMNRQHYDFETKKVVKNPESEWIHNTHLIPAIVSEELWEAANQAVSQRSFSHAGANSCCNADIRRRYDLSGKIICGICGKPYYRTHRQCGTAQEAGVTEWKCSTFLEKGRPSSYTPDHCGCDGIHVDEEILLSLLSQAAAQDSKYCPDNFEFLIENTINILRKLWLEEYSGSICSLLSEQEHKLCLQKDLLLSKLLDNVISDSDYQRRNQSLEKSLMKLEKQKYTIMQKNNSLTLEHRLESIRDYLQSEGFRRITNMILLQDIRQITVNRLTISFQLNSRQLTLFYPFAPTTEQGRTLDRQRIVEIMRDQPDITAKGISDRMNRPLRMVQNRIADLRKGNYIHYQGHGCHGVWEVLKAYPMDHIPH